MNNFVTHCMSVLTIIVLRDDFVLPRDRSRRSENVGCESENIGNKEPLDYRMMRSRETIVPFLFHFMPFFLFVPLHSST